jgi:flagellar protein FlbD
MIQLTRINHSCLILNADLIEHIQATPDTVITLTNGHNYLVLESPEEIIQLIVDYRRRWFDDIPGPRLVERRPATDV